MNSLIIYKNNDKTEMGSGNQYIKSTEQGNAGQSVTSLIIHKNNDIDGKVFCDQYNGTEQINNGHYVNILIIKANNCYIWKVSISQNINST